MAAERIQKLLAQAGHGSRRECETYIEAGRVRVNGQVAKLGDKADPAHDDIRLDGHKLALAEVHEYILLNKPRFVLSTTEAEEGRKTVLDLIETDKRMYPVGRLDLESEGLVLLTNDGDLANRLTHPRYGHEKEYRVLLAKRPDDRQLLAWQHGVVLADGHKTLPAEVRYERGHGKGAYVRVVMTEGRKRQIREVCTQLGLPVVRLTRVRLHTLRLGALKPGEWRHLTLAEVAELKGEKPPAAQGRPAPRRKPGQRPPRRKPEARKTGDRKPTTRKPGDAKPARGKSGDWKPITRKTDDSLSTTRKPAARKPGDRKPSEPKTGDRKPGGAKPPRRRG